MDQPPVVEPKRREGSPNPGSESDYRFPRRLVLCLDGTWNQRDSGTNVYHLSNLILEGKIEPRTHEETPQTFDPARAKPATETWIQMIYYDEGVGTGLLDSATGGAFGIGLSENVRQAYDWLVERYREGDHVFIFGFSRGSFTARSLVGMIARCGLLYRGAPLPPAQLWKGYQTMPPDPPPRSKADQSRVPNEELVQRMPRPKPGYFRQLKYLKQDPGETYKTIPKRNFNETERLLCKWSRRIPIECLAVYDTVGTFGIEALAIPWLRERRARFHDTHLTSIIRNGFHGLAIDEHRANFSPIPWQRPTAATKEDGHIEQRWFIGAHSDVGGSNDDDTLAQRPLAWFIEECAKLGLVFKPRMGGDRPDARDNPTIGDCLPLRPTADKPGNVRDSYTDFARGLWRYLIRAKRNYRRIGPPPEFQNGSEIQSHNESLDKFTLKVFSANEKVYGLGNYNPPNLYEYRNRIRDREKSTAAAISTAEDAQEPPLEKPPHLYPFNGAAGVWLAISLFGIACGAAFFVRLKVGWHWSLLDLLDFFLPLIACLADYAESSLTHTQALHPDGPDAEKRDGWLDLLLDVRLVSLGVFFVGIGFVLHTLLCILWFPAPLAEAAWLIAFCVMLLHFNASMAWAAYPMRDANFGSIRALQTASRPAEVAQLRTQWMNEGPPPENDHRLLPVHRTIWRDIIGFIPAYTVASCAGIWVTLSLRCAWYHRDCLREPFLGLLSLEFWCWFPAVVIPAVAAGLDYIEDTIHLGYLRHCNELPSTGLVKFGWLVSWVKLVMVVIGLVAVLVAVVLLSVIQVLRWVRSFLHWFWPDKDSPTLFHSVSGHHFVPGLLSLVAAGFAVWGLIKAMKAFARPDDLSA